MSNYVFTSCDSSGMRATRKAGCLTIANESNYVCGGFFCVLFIYKYMGTVCMVEDGFAIDIMRVSTPCKTFVAKVSMAFIVTFYDQTIVVEECVIRCGCKDEHQKDACLKRWLK